jgi:phospholipase C
LLAKQQQMKNRNFTVSRNHFSAKVSVMGVLAFGLLFAACKKNIPVPPPAVIDNVKHVVVIYLENHSFDNLYGSFAGANGLSDALPSNITQVDSNGKPYVTLPPVSGSTAFPTNLANNYFNIDQYVPNDQETPDVLHRYYQEQLQIDGGKMDKYALYNTSQGLSQGFYQTNL